MNNIRPVSELKNDPDSIIRTVHETSLPVFLTEKGYGDVVIMSMDAYEDMKFENEVYFKLLEAEREAEETDVRYTAEEVFASARKAASGEL